jgi:hypothetical protein
LHLTGLICTAADVLLLGAWHISHWQPAPLTPAGWRRVAGGQVCHQAG